MQQPDRWTPQMPFALDESRETIVDATGRTICTWEILRHRPPTAKNQFAVELARVWATVPPNLR